MLYDIRPRRLSIIVIFIVVILWNVLSGYYGRTFLLYLFILLIAIGLGSFRFKLEINNEHLVYHVQILNMAILHRKIYPKQINHLKLTRVGWAKKAAIIKVNNGFNVRLAVLEPPKAYDDLIDFCKKHDIELYKTKDYLILERMN